MSKYNYTKFPVYFYDGPVKGKVEELVPLSAFLDVFHLFKFHTYQIHQYVSHVVDNYGDDYTVHAFLACKHSPPEELPLQAEQAMIVNGVNKDSIPLDLYPVLPSPIRYDGNQVKRKRVRR